MYKYFLLSLGILTAAFPLRAKPTGFQLVTGEASQPAFPDANTCLIKTGSHAIIHWDGFSTDLGETIHFDQLNSNSSVLNRVIGGSESALMGSLLSNGKVYLINPNGVLIGPGARIEAASFIASTLDILDADFLSDCALLFSGTSGHSVINLGQISCPEGQVALIARKVENHGDILASHAGLGVGAEVLLQIEGEERILIQPSMNSLEECEGAALLNAGSIEALLVELKSGKNPYEKAIQSSGSISATSLHVEGGRVFLVAESGLAEVSGTIDASNVNGIGGQVHILGDIVHLTECASIDASGKSGGGEVLIGGGFQGDPNFPSAHITWAGPDTQVKADAIENGDGGLVVFWSDEATLHYGKISVRGGEFGGNGGQAEVSAPNLEYHGIVDGRAPMGQMGNLLLDPNDFVIGAAATTGTFSICNPPRIYNAVLAPAINQILNTAVNTQLLTCALTISTVGTPAANTGSITVSSPLSWATANTLTLTAASFLTISAAITSSSATTGFTAMNFSSNGTSAAANSGITLSAGGILTSSGGNIQLVGNASTAAASGHGVNINGGSIVSGAGTISVAGNVPLGPTSVSIGVRLNTLNAITSATGAINVSGRSQATGAGSHGVSQLLAWTTGTTGLVTFGSIIGTVSGCRGGSGGASHGMNVGNTFSTMGSVTAINQIIGGTGTGSHGFITASSFSSTNAGTINITASTTAGGATASHGVFISSALSTTGVGNITLIGTASATNSGASRGVFVIPLSGNINSPNGTISIGGAVPLGATGAGVGVQFTVANPVTSTMGAINISGTSASTLPSSFGFNHTLSWTTGTTGLVTFGAPITDGTVTVTGCRGGSGNGSTGLLSSQVFSTTGSIEATNQIVSGAGAAVSGAGFNNFNIFRSTGGGTINITASSMGGGLAANHGLRIDGPLSTTGAGNIRLIGTSSPLSTSGSNGVNINAPVSSVSGTISMGGIAPPGVSVGANGFQMGALGSITSVTGAINISGTSASGGAGAMGIEWTAPWTTGTSGPVTFGSTINDGTVSVTGCQGGSGISSHGINCGGSFSTAGSVTAIIQIVGGIGAGSHGFNNSSSFSSTNALGGSSINITASTISAVMGSSNGINIGAALFILGAGTIKLIGTASSANTGTSIGVNVGALVSSGTGTISIGGIAPAPPGIMGTGFGVNLGIANAVFTGAPGAINISGTCATPTGFSHGVNTLGWIIPAAVNVTFGAPIIDANLVTVEGCKGGGSSVSFASNGVNIGGNFSTGGSVTAINQIVGGIGTGSIGFSINPTFTFASTGAGAINITASTLAGGATPSYGISVGGIGGGGMSTTGAGTIKLIGTGSNANSALISAGVLVGALISSGSGTIQVGGRIPAGVGTIGGVGVHLASMAMQPFSTTGTVTISGTSAGNSGSNHGVFQVNNWTPGGSVIFGAQVSDTFVTIEGCIGGSGAVSHGINRTASLTPTTGSITAINQIIGGSGAGSHGFHNGAPLSSSAAGNIFITASTTAAQSGLACGINVASSISTTGAGAIRLIGTGSSAVGFGLPKGVLLLNATVTSGSGTIQIGGAVPAGSTGINGVGVDFQVINPVATAGPIFISGTSATSGNDSHGFSLSTGFTWAPAASALTFGSTITDTFVSVTGCMGGGGNTSHGINITGALTTTCPITATTSIIGGSGTSSAGFRTSANIATTGALNPINIVASSSASANTGYGIHIFSGAVSTTLGADINLTGTGGTGDSSSYGIFVSGGAPSITTSGAGDITLTGAGGSFGTPADGVVVSGGSVTSAIGGTGSITFNVAAPSTRLGFSAAISTPIATGGPVSLNADAEVFLGGTANITSGGLLTLGKVDGPGALIATTDVTLVIDNPMGSTTPLSTITLSAPGAAVITLSTSLAADLSIFLGDHVDVVGSSSATTVGAGGMVTFTSTVDGPSDLTVSADMANFSNTVGMTTPLSSLTVTGTTAISVTGNHTVSGGPMSYNGPVLMNTPMVFTNNGAAATTFTSSITGNFSLDITAPSTSVSVSGTIDTSGGVDLNGEPVTILAGGDATISSPILTRGGFPATVSPNGGNVIITSTGGSVSIHDIDTSADPSMAAPFGGNGGDVTLQPNSALNATPLGDQAAGFIIFNGTIIFAPGGFMTGVGGNISFSPLGRASPPIAASIYSNFATDEILTVVGGSFTMGLNEMMTIFGDATLTLTGAVATSDIISLDTLTINAASIFLNPRSSCQILNFLGTTYTSPAAHLYSRLAPFFSTAVQPPGAVTGTSSVPNRVLFKMLLYYVPDGLALNFEKPLDPAIIRFFEEPIVNEFGIANSQLSFLLPLNLIWPDWQWPRQGYFCESDEKKCQKPFFELETFNIESHEFD